MRKSYRAQQRIDAVNEQKQATLDPFEKQQRSALNGLVRQVDTILTGKSIKVANVEQKNLIAYTDGQTITLSHPRIIDLAGTRATMRDRLAVTLAVNAHEVGHVRFTPSFDHPIWYNMRNEESWDSTRRSGGLPQVAVINKVHNMLEDQRQELLFGIMYPKARDYHRLVVSLMLREAYAKRAMVQGKNGEREQNSAAIQAESFVLLYGRRHLVPTVILRALEKRFTAKFGPQATRLVKRHITRYQQLNGARDDDIKEMRLTARAVADLVFKKSPVPDSLMGEQCGANTSRKGDAQKPMVDEAKQDETINDAQTALDEYDKRENKREDEREQKRAEAEKRKAERKAKRAESKDKDKADSDEDGDDSESDSESDEDAASKSKSKSDKGEQSDEQGDGAGSSDEETDEETDNESSSTGGDIDADGDEDGDDSDGAGDSSDSADSDGDETDGDGDSDGDDSDSDSDSDDDSDGAPGDGAGGGDSKTNNEYDSADPATWARERRAAQDALDDQQDKAEDNLSEDLDLQMEVIQDEMRAGSTDETEDTKDLTLHPDTLRRSEELAHIFDITVQDLHTEDTRYLRSGKLDMRRISSVLAGNSDRMFRKRKLDVSDKARMAISMMVDISSSMGRTFPTEEDAPAMSMSSAASDVAIAISKACEMGEHMTRISVFASPDDARTIKGWRARAGRYVLSGYGYSTDPLPLLRETPRDMDWVERNEEVNNYVVIMFTDGGFNDPVEAKTYIASATAKGAYVYMVGLNFDIDATYREAGVRGIYNIKDFTTLASTMTTLLTDLSVEIAHSVQANVV